jgi:protein-S-isoprenylcysteine O-methyltransferase
MLLIYILAYALLAGFFLIEFRTRRGKNVCKLDTTSFDHGSTRLVGIAFVAACLLLIAAPILNHWNITNFANLTVRICGLIVALGGLIIRAVAVRTLGAAYTRTLRQVDDRALTTRGIYKFIRHPGYLGNILLFVGVAGVLGNWLCLGAIIILLAVAYLYRINTEEKMLVKIFGAKYRAYQKSSWRLVPGIF